MTRFHDQIHYLSVLEYGLGETTWQVSFSSFSSYYFIILLTEQLDWKRRVTLHSKCGDKQATFYSIAFIKASYRYTS